MTHDWNPQGVNTTRRPWFLVGIQHRWPIRCTAYRWQRWTRHDELTRRRVTKPRPRGLVTVVFQRFDGAGTPEHLDMSFLL